MNINIQTIKHQDQRYVTCGDWWLDDYGVLQIRVSDMNNKIYEWLIAEHEINEFLRCDALGISEKVVSDYDKAFEELREKYPELIGDQEPGDMVSAPYNKPHIDATAVEMHSAIIHNVNWKQYSDTVNSL